MANEIPKAKSLTLSVSSATFSELAMRMQEKGINIGENNITALSTIIIEKNTELVQPYEWALVRLRKDCADIITKLFEFYPDGTSIPMAIDELYKYILTNELPELEEVPTKDEWK